MVDAARRASADRITAVIPFFGYARQDRKDQPRVPITAKLVANLLHAAGVSRVLTMDLHAQQVQGFFDIPVDHLYSMPVLLKYMRTRLTRKTVVVSPDVGGLKMASAYSQALGVNLAIVAKQRKSATETKALYVIGDVEGCDVLLVDDLTETAGHADLRGRRSERARRPEDLRRRRPRRPGRYGDSPVAKLPDRGINNDEQHARAHGGGI